jgi:hypothetical protein
MSQEFQTPDLSNLLPSNTPTGNSENSQSISGVDFHEQRKSLLHTDKKNGVITEMVIKYSRGKIENEKQANIVLIALMVIIFALAIFVSTRGGPTSQQPTIASTEQTKQFMSNNPPPR